MKLHKHYDSIIAWAEGKLIQQEYPHGNWADCPDNNPQWENTAYIFRVKPEPKPKFRVERTLTYNKVSSLMWVEDEDNVIQSRHDHLAQARVKFTFHGETNELISVEKI